MKINVLIEKNGINSKGIYDTNDESILVLKGSKIRKEIAPHFKDSTYDILRKKLISEGVIQDFRFTTDYKFKKASPASSVILGSNSNGKIEWISENDGDLHLLEKKQSSKEAKNKSNNNELIKELLLICEKEANVKIREFERKMIERTQINIEDTESMLKDIIILRDEMDLIKRNMFSLSFLHEVIDKLWDEYNYSNWTDQEILDAKIIPVPIEEVEKGYRITKLNYVWELMSQKDKLKKVLHYANIKNFSQCFKEIYEFGNVSASSIDDVEYEFNSLDDPDQISYLLRGLLDINNVDEWFDDYDELLVSSVFKEEIDNHEWYEVMPTVISNKELDEFVRRIFDEIKDNIDDYFSEYVKKGIYNYNPRLIHKKYEELNIEEKLYIYALVQPDY